MKHELKTIPKYFQPIWAGDKTFEIRVNDRNFKEKDEILLREWVPWYFMDIPTGPAATFDGEYTGREVSAVIKYLTAYNQRENYVVFSFEVKVFSECPISINGGK